MPEDERLPRALVLPRVEREKVVSLALDLAESIKTAMMEADELPVDRRMRALGLAVRLLDQLSGYLPQPPQEIIVKFQDPDLGTIQDEPYWEHDQQPALPPGWWAERDRLQREARQREREAAEAADREWAGLPPIPGVKNGDD